MQGENTQIVTFVLVLSVSCGSGGLPGQPPSWVTLTDPGRVLGGLEVCRQGGGRGCFALGPRAPLEAGPPLTPHRLQAARAVRQAHVPAPGGLREEGRGAAVEEGVLRSHPAHQDEQKGTGRPRVLARSSSGGRRQLGGGRGAEGEMVRREGRVVLGGGAAGCVGGS